MPKIFPIKNISAIIFFCLLVAFQQAKAQQGWHEVAATDSISWEIQSGSYEETQTKGGEPIAVVISRSTTKANKRIDLEKKYVSLANCRNGMGKIVTLNVSGKYEYENDFVIGGGTVATAIAEFICSVYAIKSKIIEDKGI